jgi:DNA-binding NtrC family response regulator
MLSMPVCTKDQATRQAPLALNEATGEPAILVVEDDLGVRRFICALLRQATRLSVADAGDPFTALSIVRKCTKPIDLLISDINLTTHITGIDLAQELVRTNPAMKGLLISGTDCPPRGMPPAWRFLSKPFTVESFLACVALLCRARLSAQISGTAS